MAKKEKERLETEWEETQVAAAANDGESGDNSGKESETSQTATPPTTPSPPPFSPPTVPKIFLMPQLMANNTTTNDTEEEEEEEKEEKGGGGKPLLDNALVQFMVVFIYVLSAVGITVCLWKTLSAAYRPLSGMVNRVLLGVADVRDRLALLHRRLDEVDERMQLRPTGPGGAEGGGGQDTDYEDFDDFDDDLNNGNGSIIKENKGKGKGKGVSGGAAAMSDPLADLREPQPSTSKTLAKPSVKPPQPPAQEGGRGVKPGKGVVKTMMQKVF